MSSLLRRRSSRQLELSSPVALQFGTPPPPNCFSSSASPSSSYYRSRRRSSASSSFSSTSSSSSSFRFYNSSKSSSSTATTTFTAAVLCCLLLVTLAPWVRPVYTTVQLYSLQQRMETLKLQTAEYQQQRAVAQQELANIRRNVELSHDANQASLSELQEHGWKGGEDELIPDYDNTESSSSSSSESQSIEDKLLQRVDSLTSEIPRASGRSLKQSGLLFRNNQVEIVVASPEQFPNNDHHHLLLTLAPTTVLPHTVDTFLRSLHHYKGWTLHVSHPHGRLEAVQAVRPGLYVSTSVTHGRATKATAAADTAALLQQVIVPEHAPHDVPLQKYAVVYTDHHGPHFGIVMDMQQQQQQQQHDKAIVIGHITQGREILDYLYERGPMVSLTMQELRLAEQQTDSTTATRTKT